MKKIVLAYSGSLNATVALKWLLQTYQCDVITVTADLGQPEDMLGIEEKALANGASKAYVLDLREEFARDYVFPMMRAAARYESRYLLGSAIARPCIAHALVEVARAEGAGAVAHGASARGNDQLRFEFAIKALDPALRVIAPWREWNLTTPQAVAEFAEENDIQVARPACPYSVDSNVLQTSFADGGLENPGSAPGADCHLLVVPPEQAPDQPETVEVGFVRGNPVSVNGEQLPPFELLEKLGKLGGENGIGREDMVENRYAGMKRRCVYENPAGTLLFTLHRDLEGICMDRELLNIRDLMAVPYSHAVYNGYWFSPEREAMQAFFDKSQDTVTGIARARLYKGNILPLLRTSPYSLVPKDTASFEKGEYSQNDAAGFIHLNAARLGLYAGVKKRMGR